MDFLYKLKNVMLGGHDGKVPAERRYTPRIVVPIDGTSLTEDGRGFSTLITDVGLYGMRLESPRPLSVGTVVNVRVTRGQGIIALSKFEVDTIRTEVVWCKRKSRSKEHIIGVKYSDTRQKLNASWVKFIFQKFGLNTGATLQRRRDIRIRSKVPVTMVDAEGTSTSAEAVNLGLGGLLIASRQVFPDGALLQLRIGPYQRLPELAMRGSVVRRRLSKKAEAWLLGVAFMGGTYDDSKLLTRYLLKVLQESDRADEAANP